MTATRIGGYTARGFSSSSAQRRFNDTSISSTDHGSVSLSASAAAAKDAPVEEGRIRLDVLEEEPREPRELAEAADLLLHERSRRADALLRPVAALLS